MNAVTDADPRIDLIWPLLTRPGCDLWEQHQARQLAARILHTLDAQPPPIPPRDIGRTIERCP